MAVEAPISRFKKNNLKMYIVACVIAAVWFGYDGYLNEKFKTDHTDTNGKPDSTLYFNQKGAPIMLGAAIVLGFFFFAAKDRKIVADDTELKVPAQDSIAYSKIESIDRTHFAKKGYFVVNYKDWKDRPASIKLSDRKWDNLAAVLDHLTAKIS
ncbi:MAG: hypothetical protein A2178_02895 [Planctomycetes bacterium GWC2_49_10]|nr:MAG: hypothetical protein A2178_02895 [Planctomycetes bacterium GWC2_49_10]